MIRPRMIHTIDLSKPKAGSVRERGFHPFLRYKSCGPSDMLHFTTGLTLHRDASLRSFWQSGEGTVLSFGQGLFNNSSTSRKKTNNSNHKNNNCRILLGFDKNSKNDT